MTNTHIRLTIRVTAEQYQALIQAAKQRGTSQAEVVRSCLQQEFFPEPQGGQVFTVSGVQVTVPLKAIKTATRQIQQGFPLRATKTIKEAISTSLTIAIRITDCIRKSLEGKPRSAAKAELKILDLTVVCHRCGGLIRTGEKRWVIYGDDGYDEHYHSYLCD